MLLILGAILLAAFLFVEINTIWLLNRSRATPLTDIAKPATLDLAEGRRMAILVGCLEGCHGPVAEGNIMEVENTFRLTAPPIGETLKRYSDEEAVRLLRYGIKKDGRTSILMPAATFYPLSDDDIARIIAHMRTLDNAEETEEVRRIEWLGKLALLTGYWRLSADEVDPTRERWGELPRTTAFERGRYLTSITCAECHGVDFEGVKFEGSPSLRIAASYPDDAFRTLLRTGVPIGGRDLGIMSETAKVAFHLLTDEEIADIHHFLKANYGVEDE